YNGVPCSGNRPRKTEFAALFEGRFGREATLPHIEYGFDSPRSVSRAVRPEPESGLPLHFLPDPPPVGGGGALPGNLPHALADLGAICPRDRVRRLGLRHRPQPGSKSPPQAEASAPAARGRAAARS